MFPSQLLLFRTHEDEKDLSKVVIKSLGPVNWNLVL